MSNDVALGVLGYLSTISECLPHVNYVESNAMCRFVVQLY